MDQNDVLSLRTILTRLLPHNCYKHTITYKAEKTAVTVGQRQKEEEKKKACLVPAREKERQDCKGERNNFKNRLNDDGKEREFADRMERRQINCVRKRLDRCVKQGKKHWRWIQTVSLYCFSSFICYLIFKLNW